MSKNLKNINIPGYGDIDVAQISTGELAKYNPELEHKDKLYIASDTNNILYNKQQLGIPTYKATELYFYFGEMFCIIIDNLDFNNLPTIFYVKDCIKYPSEIKNPLGDVIVIPTVAGGFYQATAIRIPSKYNDTIEVAYWSVSNSSIYGVQFDPSSNYSNFGFRKVVTLDESDKIPSSYLPSYVDDVLEYSTKDALPETGEYGKIYVTTDDNKTYRWSGSTYIEIGNPLSSSELEYFKDITKAPILVDLTIGDNKYPSFKVDGDKVNLSTLSYRMGQLNPNTTEVPLATINSAGLMSMLDKEYLDALNHNWAVIRVGREEIIQGNHRIPFYSNDIINIPIISLYRSTYDGEIHEPDFPLWLEGATSEHAGVLTASDKTNLDILSSKFIKDNYRIIGDTKSSEDDKLINFGTATVDGVPSIVLDYHIEYPKTGEYNHEYVAIPEVTNDYPGLISSDNNKHLEQLYDLFYKNGFIGGVTNNELLESRYTDNIQITYSKLSPKYSLGTSTTGLILHSATTEKAGVMSANDKSKLDSIEVEKLYTSDNLDLSNYVPKTEFDTVKTELDTLKAEFAKFKEDTTALLNDLYNIVKTN